MKILYLVKYFDPFDRGGSEWSTHDLAKLVQKAGHSVTILTPNYGSKSEELIDGLRIIRFPFPIKLTNKKGKVAPYWTSNIFWFIYTTIVCTWYVKKEQINIIHAHNTEFIPATVLAGSVLNIPTIATFRDYQAICPLGFCLWNKEKACSLSTFYSEDYTFFRNNYLESKDFLSSLLIFVAVYRAKLSQYIVKYFTKKIIKKIAVSQKVKQIFAKNGVNGLDVIFNPVIVKNLPQRGTKTILYIGKLSPGKGIGLLIELIPNFLKKIPDVKFVIVGSGILSSRIKNIIKTNKIEPKVQMLGQLSHKEVLRRIRTAGLVLIPSLWPEPLPRSAIEPILSGVPVVAANVGGNSEVVINNKYGLLSLTSKDDFEQKTILAYKKKDLYKKNIVKDLEELREKFSTKVVSKYLKMYETINR